MNRPAISKASRQSDSAQRRAELLFVPILGHVIECETPIDAALIGGVARSFSTIDLGAVSRDELDELICELIPAHLEAAAQIVRRRAAELRGSVWPKSDRSERAAAR